MGTESPRENFRKFELEEEYLADRFCDVEKRAFFAYVAEYGPVGESEVQEFMAESRYASDSFGTQDLRSTRNDMRELVDQRVHNVGGGSWESEYELSTLGERLAKDFEPGEIL